MGRHYVLRCILSQSWWAPDNSDTVGVHKRLQIKFWIYSVGWVLCPLMLMRSNYLSLKIRPKYWASPIGGHHLPRVRCFQPTEGVGGKSS